jgi:hypothetical protein
VTQTNRKTGERQILFEEETVAAVKSDFERRRAARRPFEAQWQLNENFALGNQHCSIDALGEVRDDERDYFWQERESFNHIASIVETRLAKLNRVRPVMSVRPASGDDCDVKTAKAASKILSSASAALNLDALLADGAVWSELTGSAFYKISWDENGGGRVGSIDGAPVFEGDVKIEVCSPYELYPDELTRSNIADCRSLIHARAVDVDDIESTYGVRVPPDGEARIVAPSMFSGGGGLSLSGTAQGVGGTDAGKSALVIERYTLPNKDNPSGEFVAVAGNRLLYYGDLPYVNGENETRTFPFVKQDSLKRAGCFFGQSMVERAIPIQRAYNAVKNRKHEFLNRIAMGVLTVEDGSVDLDNLAAEGLSPGKIIVYRQGGTPPRLMNPGDVPSDFSAEEDRLLNEFISVSGVSEIMRSSSVPSVATSGVALQLLIEQDDTRLSVTAELVRQAAREIGRQVLRLYKQFASRPRLTRFVGENGEVELMSFTASDIGCDDVVFDTENELNSTLAMRQNTVFELLKSGLLHDGDGRLDEETRYRILDTLGYGGWESKTDERAVHIKRADRENAGAVGGEKLEVCELDNHELHIARHTRFALTDSNFVGRRGGAARERLLSHIREHKRYGEEESGTGE